MLKPSLTWSLKLLHTLHAFFKGLLIHYVIGLREPYGSLIVFFSGLHSWIQKGEWWIQKL